jgi:hypothetical protein
MPLGEDKPDRSDGTGQASGNVMSGFLTSSRNTSRIESWLPAAMTCLNRAARAAKSSGLAMMFPEPTLCTIAGVKLPLYPVIGVNPLVAANSVASRKQTRF